MKRERINHRFLCVSFIFLSFAPFITLFGQTNEICAENPRDTILRWCIVSPPLKNIRLTSSFGYRRHPLTGRQHFHGGVDLAASHDSVYSILAGRVAKVAESSSLGRYIVIGHGGIESIYGHLSVIVVQQDQLITAGQVIAITGTTGKVTGEHLHFAIKSRGKFIPPLRFLAGLLPLIRTNYDR